MKVNKKQFAEDGYLLIKNFFDRGILDNAFLDTLKIFSISMNNHLEIDFDRSTETEYVEKKMFEFFKKDIEAFINTGKQVQHTFNLWRIATSSQIEDLLINLGLDFPNLSVRPSFFFNSRFLDNTGHYWKLGSHQDWRSSQGSLDSVTLWYPYVDCNKSLGALEVIPGSHFNGLLEAGDVDYYSEIKSDQINESEFVSVEMNKGDLLIFNSFLVHRSGTNVTDRVRWSSQLRYNNLNEKSFIKRNMPNPYIYKPAAELVKPGPPSRKEIKNFFQNLNQ